SLVALFAGGFLFVFLAVPINDRFLPLLLSPRSLMVNGILGLACAGVAFLLHRHLRGRTGVDLVLSALNLVAFFSLCLALGQYVDTFGAVTLPAIRSLGLFGALILLCTVGYLVVDRLARAVGSVAMAPAVVSLLALVAVGIVLRMRIADAPAAVPQAGSPPNVLWVVMDTTPADHPPSYRY